MKSTTFQNRYGNTTLLPLIGKAQALTFDSRGQVFLDGHRVIGIWWGHAGSRAPKRGRPRLGDWKLIKGKWYERRCHRTQIAPGVSALQVAGGRPVYEWVAVSET
jgi:hypothetical protein